MSDSGVSGANVEMDVEGLPPFLTVSQFACLLNVRRRTIWKYVQDRKLPFYRLGATSRGTLRFHRNDVLRFLLESRVSPLEE